MEWIGLHLPWLSLESLAASLPSEWRNEPLALVDARTVVAANAAAQHLGVRAGLKQATALALAPQLRLGPVDGARDAQALIGVAHAALAFTPAVTLSPPASVLLEVQASLRCFGGRKALRHRLMAAIAPLGHHVAVASGPTAHGAALLAQWLAQVATDRPGAGASLPRLHCADLPSLQQRLGDLPLGLLAAGRPHAESLQGMGLRTLADVLRLPRAGLTRRFGEALLDEIDRALGRQPDPRSWVVLPPVFESRLELFARADTAEQVLHGAAVLLARLMIWAAARHARVRRFTLGMAHEPRHRDAGLPVQTALEIALAEPSQDAAHVLSLLRERLGRQPLPAPTLELHLHCDDIALDAPPHADLFPTPRSQREGLTRLIERLQARLGREQVQRFVLDEDHRPERAQTLVPAEGPVSIPAGRAMPGGQGGRAPGSGVRPVWLLREPRPLAERRHLPVLEGHALQLLAGPERLEAGWWDGALAERDYFIAQAAEGALVWVFRARLPLTPGVPGSGWYLQGRFG